MAAVLLIPVAAGAEVRVIHEADGTVRITNRSAADRARDAAGSRIYVDDGVLTVRLRSGAIVVPQADRGQHDAAFEAAAARHDLPVALLKAVARVESAFDPMAVSHAGAQGLMQLMPQTAQAMGVIDPFDPAQSIEGGARYLRKMLDRFEVLELALAAYNAGPTAVTRYGGIPPFEETRRYVGRVLGLLPQWTGTETLAEI
jgi:soluble lytic murein transglycosylase-like protein